jgi:replicative DNA helicase
MASAAFANDPMPVAANVEEEAALLGALLHEPKIIDSVADRVKPEHFHEPLHGRIFSAILDLHGRGKTVSVITLKPLFADDPAMQQLGGPGYLVTIMGTSAVGVIGAKDFADEIRELAHRRELIAGLQQVIEDAHNPRSTAAELMGDAEAALMRCAGTDSSTKEMTGAEAVRAHLKQIENGLPPGVTCGIAPIDEALGPIRPGDLDIVAGRPGMFKTGTALNYARGAAERGHGVLFVSLEMKAEQLGMRLAAEMCFDGHSGINFGNIERGDLAPEHFRRIHRANEHLAELPLVIADMPGCRAGQVAAIIRRWKRRMAAREQKLELVIVDYLQLLDADRQSDNRTSEITQISRALKVAAKANDVGVLALAQLSRKVEEREEKRPRLADLRESGSIEQDADSVLFLYRDEYYLDQTEPPEGHERRAKWEAAMQACQGDIEFICAKRRQGQTGIKHGRYFGCFQAVRG